MNIRQTIIRVWLLFIVGFVIAPGENQARDKRTDTEKDEHLISTLKPAFSEGFTTWKGYDNAEIHYEIDVISKESIVETISTTKNFHKFNLKTYNGYDFRVTAINSKSNEVIGVGPQDIIATQIDGYEPMRTTCSKVCNGPNYIWQMDLMQDDTPGWSITDPAHLALRAYYLIPFDATPGAVNPTWEAMTPQYYQNNSGHYNMYNYAVETVILPATPSASAPNIYDAFGSQMFGYTYFVQKKMEQFKYAQNNRTTTFNPSSTICSGGLTNVGGWIQKFNAYPHQDNMPASGVNDAATLSCTSAFGGFPSGSGGQTGSWTASTAPSSIFYFCPVGPTGFVISITPCDENGNGNGPPVFGGGYIGGTYHPAPGEWIYGIDDLQVDHIEFEILNDKEQNLVVLGEDGDFTGDNLDFKSLKSGLYQVTVYKKDGRGYPRYVEIVNNFSVGNIRD